MNRLCVSIALVFGVVSTAAAETSVSLTSAQREVIDRSIDRLPSKEEQQLASKWSEAKKVAEFICRPAALSQLQKWDPKADRVFLGTDDPDTLTLETNQLLRGSGHVRTGNDWMPFEFTCALDPKLGKSVSFTSNLPEKRSQGSD